MGDDFPKDVKQFIDENIYSLAQLEVLLALRREPERLWTTDEITGLLYLRREMVDELLNNLVRRGLAVGENAGFRYQPSSSATSESIDRLALLYQERRVAVTTEIFSKPIDFVKAFADAFRLRGKE